MLRGWHPLGMRPTINQAEDLRETSDPGPRVAAFNPDEVLVCPIEEALWGHYRRHNPHGLAVQRVDEFQDENPEFAAYAAHIDSCDECKGISSADFRN